jgi:hypothetical protein
VCRRASSNAKDGPNTDTISDQSQNRGSQSESLTNAVLSLCALCDNININSFSSVDTRTPLSGPLFASQEMRRALTFRALVGGRAKVKGIGTRDPRTIPQSHSASRRLIKRRSIRYRTIRFSYETRDLFSLHYTTSYCTPAPPLHSTPTSPIMPKSCIMCNAEASTRRQVLYCDACMSTMYCSTSCQKKDWKQQQHKQICPLLNVGQGDMQWRDDIHTRGAITVQERFERGEGSLNRDMKRFFKLFTESTKDGSRAAAQKMKKFPRRRSKQNQEFLLFHSLYFLVRSSNLEMLSWPNKQSTSRDAPVRRSQRAVRRRGVGGYSAPHVDRSGRSFRLFYPCEPDHPSKTACGTGR